MTITVLGRADHETTDEAILGSVGWPRTGVEVAILDAAGNRMPVDAIGEVAVRGDVVMAGYWHNPQATHDALRGGWLYTGDLGSIDARGLLTLRDRSKDMIISGGSNVYPREVEEALLAHALVSEVSVIGEPDPQWGEVVVAVVVPRGSLPPTVAELDAHCVTRIARFKRPRHYHFVDALPKNSYGKVVKRELRATLATGKPQAASPAARTR
jgi:acyl-CoA synthetase (AMP-forming)/AMP-acid ligase II